MDTDKCVCNKCGRKILISVKEEVIDQDNDGKDVVEEYFVCPDCGQRYTVMISDEYMRALIRVRLRNKFDRKKTVKVKKDMMRHLKELKRRYGRE